MRFATFCSLAAEFNDLGFEQTSVFEGETQQGPDAMKSLHSCGARVQMDAPPILDGLHQEQMTVTANEYIGAVLKQSAPYSFGISSRPSADVGHPDATSPAFDVLMLRKIPAEELIVYVAVDSNEGFHCSNRVGDFEIANVARVPHLITRGEVMQDPVVDVTVGIAEQSNAHAANFGLVIGFTPPLAFSRDIHSMRSIAALFTALFLLCAASWAQPRMRLHSESKKAIKLYQKAMERSREAMVPKTAHGSSHAEDLEAAREEVEANLLKCLEIDPEFAEAERVLAALRFDAGEFEESRDRYAHYLTVHGPDFIRDHFLWAEAARYALDPRGMKNAMSAMRAIPGVMEGPDVGQIDRVEKDSEFMSMSLADPKKVVPEPLPFPVSTGEDEYFPSVWLAGEALIFTRKVTDARWQQGQEDLFMARKDGEEWQTPQPLRGLNTLDNEGAASLSGDGSILCFTLCREADRTGQGEHQGSCDLYVSEQFEGQWSRPENIRSVNSTGWESQPCLSPDGQSLYFTRGAGKGGRRKYDLFVAQRQEDGEWGTAHRLGGTINSNGKEMRPFIHPDGRHFFFATDGRPGMGGMDLFVSTLHEDGSWGEPVNMGWPINTPDDETGLVVASDGVTGYFSREVEGQLDLHVMYLPEEVAADPTAAMEGRMSSQNGKAIGNGVIRLMDRATGQSFARAEAAPDGSYHVPVPMDRAFVVIAEAPGYMLVSESIEPGQIEGRIERDFSLSALKAGAEVILRNVFFSSGSAELDQTSNAELNRVGQWLADQPDVLIEVGGHTDDVGADQANLILSSERAQAVRSALIAAGAQPDQLVAKGYGRTRPAVEGTSDAARSMNRRTTLTVLSKAE